jgi:DNA-binding ferritin-like protein (Dps family)
MARKHTTEELEEKLREWSDYQNRVRQKGDEFRKELAAITKKPLYTKKDADRVAELVDAFSTVMHDMPEPL